MATMYSGSRAAAGGTGFGRACSGLSEFVFSWRDRFSSDRTLSDYAILYSGP